MKIRISTVFLIITMFHHFAELNAMEPGEGSSSGDRRKLGRPRGSVTKRIPGQVLGRPRGSVTRPGSNLNQDQLRFEDPSDGPPHRIVYYGQIKIKVWLSGSLVQKTIYPYNYIPQGRYYGNNNFLVRTLKRSDITLVAYISQDEKLIGVRPPALAAPKYNLEPTLSEWYINYATTYFKVHVTNLTPTRMSLMPKNVHVPAESAIKLETVAGITFRIFKNNLYFNITGVELVSYARIAP